MFELHLQLMKGDVASLVFSLQSLFHISPGSSEGPDSQDPVSCATRVNQGHLRTSKRSSCTAPSTPKRKRNQPLSAKSLHYLVLLEVKASVKTGSIFFC
jgi:hypothetical protein